MENFILFINSFLSYLLVFVLITILVVSACVIGAILRKNKDKKELIALESAVGQSKAEE